MIPQNKKPPLQLASVRKEMEHPPASPMHDGPAAADESFIHLGQPPNKFEPKASHSLRKHDLPLSPAPASTHRTEIPISHHDSQGITQIREREAQAAMHRPGMDFSARYSAQTASPFLYATGYLLIMIAGITAYQRFHYITPVVLLSLSAIIVLYIALRKPHSRHHAALLFIAVFLTFVFGALHYAPLFQNAP